MRIFVILKSSEKAMKKRFIRFILPALAVGYFSSAHAQVDKDILNWYNGKDGMQTEAAYKLVKDKDGKEVIVAVIDSGMDIDHEDLQGQIWVNTDEIAGNGIDDDNNGYIDDVHGWNFLGNANGENQDATRLELTRIYAQLKPKYENKKAEDISSGDQKEYDLYKEVKAEYEKSRGEFEGYIKQIDTYINEIIPAALKSAENELGADYTAKDVKKWKPADDQLKSMKQIAYAVKSGRLSIEQLEGQKESIQSRLDCNYNIDCDDRSLIGDDPYDITDTNYGNNDVEGPDALHGTHVGGIIGSIRGNDLGGDGVATNVKLMSLRAVPNGDEHDKDIALAIRYAVDNGAVIINGSFGKNYSPKGKYVYDAIKYAESKGVLFVHAAGNDSKDVDVEPNYPTSFYDFQTEEFTNYLTIGASSRYVKSKFRLFKKNDPSKLAAPFSNYGTTKVDVFAPGLEIYNTIQGDTTYMTLQGTSMASPMVAGAAAFLKSYYPTLTMVQIKDIMLKSARTYDGLQVVLPGTRNELVDFKTLSVTGGVVNLVNCVEMAEEMTAKQ